MGSKSSGFHLRPSPTGVALQSLAQNHHEANAKRAEHFKGCDVKGKHLAVRPRHRRATELHISHFHAIPLRVRATTWPAAQEVRVPHYGAHARLSICRTHHLLRLAQTSLIFPGGLLQACTWLVRGTYISGERYMVLPASTKYLQLGASLRTPRPQGRQGTGAPFHLVLSVVPPSRARLHKVRTGWQAPAAPDQSR